MSYVLWLSTTRAWVNVAYVICFVAVHNQDLGKRCLCHMFCGCPQPGPGQTLPMSYVLWLSTTRAWVNVAYVICFVAVHNQDLGKRCLCHMFCGCPQPGPGQTLPMSYVLWLSTTRTWVNVAYVICFVAVHNQDLGKRCLCHMFCGCPQPGPG